MPKLKKRLIILASVLILCTALVIFSLTALAKQGVSTETKTTENSGYVLKDYLGRPAIFQKDNEKPMLILDVYTSELPPKDQKRLLEGIEAKSFEQILSLAENYE